MEKQIYRPAKLAEALGHHREEGLSMRAGLQVSDVTSIRVGAGGTYPAACLYKSSDDVTKHPKRTEKQARAFAWTLRWT